MSNVLPPVNRPTYYLHRSVSMPKSRWELLTGLPGAPQSSIVKAYERVVQKELYSGHRPVFGEWKSNFSSLSPMTKQRLEANIRRGEITHGLMAEGWDPDAGEPRWSSDYFVMLHEVDPAAPQDWGSKTGTDLHPGLLFAVGAVPLVGIGLLPEQRQSFMLWGMLGLVSGLVVVKTFSKKEEVI